MDKIASPDELQRELRTLVAECRHGVSRLDMAQKLGTLANRLAANSDFLNSIPPRAHQAILKLDKNFIGTPNYMGVAPFWNAAYKHSLKDASPAKRRAVHQTFLKNRLQVDGVSPEHEAIVKNYDMYLGF